MFAVEALAADEGEVDVVALERCERDVADEGAGVRADDAARRDQVERPLQVVVHEAHGIRDDREVLLSLELTDECEAGRARIDHDGVAVADEAGGALGDGLLVLAEDCAALDEGDVVVRVLVEHGAAIAAAQEVFAFELFEVAADGLLRDAEELRKFGNVDFPLFIQFVHDFATTLDAQHDASPLQMSCSILLSFIIQEKTCKSNKKT